MSGIAVSIRTSAPMAQFQAKELLPFTWLKHIGAKASLRRQEQCSFALRSRNFFSGGWLPLCKREIVHPCASSKSWGSRGITLNREKLGRLTISNCLRHNEPFARRFNLVTR